MLHSVKLIQLLLVLERLEGFHTIIWCFLSSCKQQRQEMYTSLRVNNYKQITLKMTIYRYQTSLCIPRYIVYMNMILRPVLFVDWVTVRGVSDPFCVVYCHRSIRYEMQPVWRSVYLTTQKYGESQNWINLLLNLPSENSAICLWRGVLCVFFYDCCVGPCGQARRWMPIGGADAGVSTCCRHPTVLVAGPWWWQFVLLQQNAIFSWWRTPSKVYSESSQTLIGWGFLGSLLGLCVCVNIGGPRGCAQWV